MNDRASQELDLLLQEGRVENPFLAEGLVKLYANHLFRFAWILFTCETDNNTVRRVLARRSTAQAIQEALKQLHRFQEQPGTFVWLLALTYQQSHPQKSPHRRAQLAAYLSAAHNLSSEDIAYILRMPVKLATAYLDGELESEISGHFPAGAPETLSPEETITLVETVQSQLTQIARSQSPFSFRHLAWIGIAVFFFFLLVRAAPNKVILLPTPVPTPVPVNTLQPGWDITPQVLPTSPEATSSDIFNASENPYLIWQSAQVLQDSTATISELVYSPVGPLLAVGFTTSEIILWDMENYEVLNKLEGHSGGIHSLAFSQDGKLLATGGGDGTIRIWEMPYGNLLQVFDGQPKYINSLSFSPRGDILAAAPGNELWLWEVNSGMKIASYETFEQNLKSVRFSPDGQLLAVSEEGGTAWILRASDGFPLLSFENQNGEDQADDLLFSPDGNFLVTVISNNSPAIIHLTGNADELQGEIIKTLLNRQENPDYQRSSTRIRDFTFSPDGSCFAVSLHDGRILIWDTKTWSPMYAPLDDYETDTAQSQLAISPDGQTIVASGHDGEIKVWQLVEVSEEAQVLHSPRYFKRADSDPYVFTFSYPNIDELESIYGEGSSLSLQEANERAGFELKIPFVDLLEGDHQLDGFYYDPSNQSVYATFWPSNSPGLLTGFTLIQRRVQLGERKMSGSNPYIGFDIIGTIAKVEPFHIGETYGEIVFGDWAYIEEENASWWNTSPQTGDEIIVVLRWNWDSNTVRLRWQEDDILYEITSYSSWNGQEQEQVREALLLLATSMFAPEQVNFPWNASYYTYTIQTGDTCHALAEQFQTTIDIIIHLNGLSAECDLSAGGSLLLPYPAEPFTTTDLNCDGQGETLFLLLDPEDPDRILGLALDVISDALPTRRTWEFTASEMGTLYIFSEPELFSIGGCEQFIAVWGGDPRQNAQIGSYRTRIFRWNGTSIWPVMDTGGWPASEDGKIASLPQSDDKPFTISFIEYYLEIHPSTGLCPNRVTDFTWNGQRFDKGVTKVVSGDCLEK